MKTLFAGLCLTLLLIFTCTVSQAQWTDSGSNLTTTDNVGIGTTSPFSNSKLDIQGDHSGGKFDSQLHLHTTNSSYGMFLGSHHETYGVISQGSHYYSSGNFTARSTISSGIIKNNGNIFFFNNTGLTSGSNFSPTINFAIGSTGNIGIGTSTPAARLQIVNQFQSSNGNTLILGSTSSSNLRLGYNTDNTWIQSHGGKPLYINLSSI